MIVLIMSITIKDRALFDGAWHSYPSTDVNGLKFGIKWGGLELA